MTQIHTSREQSGHATPAAPVGVDGGARARSRKSRIRMAKWLTILLALAPPGRIAIQLAQGHLGPNPIAEAMNRLGWWTLFWLLLSLTMTPIQLLTGMTWPIALRKTLGLTAFAYALTHFLVYFAVDQFFDLGEIAKDIVKRKFITVGFAAFVLLIPLAVTSTSGMVKRLGARRWKRLHRLVYVAAPLGVIHFVWRVKSDLREPLLFALALAILMGVRIMWRRPARPRPVVPRS
jgi:sulfoxide reductase heme-binding subunit YedZ